MNESWDSFLAGFAGGMKPGVDEWAKNKRRQRRIDSAKRKGLGDNYYEGMDEEGNPVIKERDPFKEEYMRAQTEESRARAKMYGEKQSGGQLSTSEWQSYVKQIDEASTNDAMALSVAGNKKPTIGVASWNKLSKEEKQKKTSWIPFLGKNKYIPKADQLDSVMDSIDSSPLPDDQKLVLMGLAQKRKRAMQIKSAYLQETHAKTEKPTSGYVGI